MRKSIFVLLFSILATGSFAQATFLKGVVIDSAEKASLQNTVISILRKSDSVLVKFTRADKSGFFTVSNFKAGEYILMATHPYFGDYIDNFEIKLGDSKDLGNLYMTPKSKLLAEVIFKSGSPIRIKGDTTVYTADSFRVRPGANVEELLRRLPGIQVGRNGEITAMGERVKKVLVDGEEFFGSDPGIATKNLRADVVKEVEVFDKKSDQAEFTGIDDGVKNKTINLKLKDDKKKGYFGKIEAGGGLKDKYNNSAMLNAFKGKRKIAGYGIMSNTGKTNLDWQDAQNYGGGSENITTGVNEDGAMFISISSDDGSYWGGQNGIPKNWNGGLHFSDKYNNNKQSVNAGYKFSKVNAPAVARTYSKTFLPDSSWNTNSTSNNFSSTIKQAFNLAVDYTLDSNNSLKWTTRANNNSSRTQNLFYTESINEQLQFINNSKRNSTNNSDNNSMNSSLLWRHKFKKPSRTLSLNTDFNWSNSKNTGLLYSLNNYYDNGIIKLKDTTDQQNIRNSENTAILSRLAYTEPLKKDVFLELSFSLDVNKNDNERITNIKSLNGKYEVKMDTLSNSFTFNRLVNTPGISIRWNKKKYGLTIGASAGFNNFVQKNISKNLTTRYAFVNFFPRANYTYKIKPSQSIRVNYNGNSTAPTLEQLQPIRINTDPLNVYTGNQDLKQSFRHSFSTGYNSYNVLKEKNIFSNLSFSITQNAFVQSNSVDSVGRRTYRTVNANGIYTLNLYSDYGFKVKGSKLRFGAGPTAMINRNIDFINEKKNITNTSNYGLRVSLNQTIPDKFDFYFSPSFTWNRSTASVNAAANADYWQVEGWSQARVMLPKKFEISTDANFQMRKKDPRFTQKNNFTTWNASVTKRFMKDVLEFKLVVYDLLRQNRGYQRNFNSYSFTETYYTTLRRFWLVTITWNISKNGKPATGF
jgi:outer membrane receptor protein involved in Fe transport